VEPWTGSAHGGRAPAGCVRASAAYLSVASEMPLGAPSRAYVRAPTLAEAIRMTTPLDS
jgi:hypothetical protein